MKLTTLILSLTAAGALAIGSTAFACDTCGCKSKKASPSKDAPKQAAPAKEMPTATAPMKAVVGQKAPGFELMDLEGKPHKLSDYAGKIVILEWYNPDCPYSGKASGPSVNKRGTVKRTMEMVKKANPEVVYMLINSTSNAPKDAVIKRSKESKGQWKLESPILIDHGGAVGRMYQARTTPHMYVIDGEGVLVYQGAYTDDRRGGKGEEETNYVVNAVMAASSDKAPEPANTKPWGCGVKYPR